VVDARNGIRSKMTDGAAGAFNPTWSNTGRIYFVSAREGVENIWSLQGGASAIAAQPPHDRTEPLSRAEANAPVTAEGK
jgi:hypothetical protein